jgi:hypothetical protein
MASKNTLPAEKKKKYVPVPPNKSKYTEERHTTIVEAIRSGNSKATSFRLAGIAPDTGHDWLKFGRDRADEYPNYAKLVDDVEQALAEYEASRVSLITTAADTGSWQAAAWWLERRNSETWGRHDRIKHEGNNRPTIQLNQVILKDASARELSRNLLRQLASDRPDVTLGPGDVRELAEDGEEGRDTIHSS